MPKVLERDPSWLARPAPGFQLFHHAQSPTTGSSTRASGSDGPSRKIAHRGAEVFFAVGTELRWGDLNLLRDAGEEFERKYGRYGAQASVGEEVQTQQSYRLLKTNVARPITQLSVSPSGEFLVILTSHTCHVAVLPGSSHLRSVDKSPLRVKTFQVGPTAHVLEQSPLMSALWHLLSPTGNCLVTITKDSCVRLWELDRENRSTFDEPSLAVDLKKLANATSAQVDVSTNEYGMNQGFSPDAVEMQVAAACFGGQGGNEEHGWASMTLWIAMSEGDVYALCPFLPSKWIAAPSLLPSLSTSVVEKMRGVENDSEASESTRRVAEQQCRWIAEVDTQDPMMVAGRDDLETFEVYCRPEKPGPVPKLQGPFYVGSELDIGEITDIFAIAPKVDNDALFDNDDDADEENGLSVGVVCVATSTSQVHICLDLDNVEAEWLPARRMRIFTPDEDEKDLVLYETIDLSHKASDNESWCTFTVNPTDRYEVFVSTASGVYALDFNPWIAPLENELASASESGAEFRLDILLNSDKTFVDKPIDIPNSVDQSVNTAISILDASLGFLLLTTATNIPYSAQFDVPLSSQQFAPDAHPSGPFPIPEPRAPYQPAPDLYTPSALPHLIKTAAERNMLGPTSSLKSPIRFSSATLQLLTEAHRLLSAETHRVGLAASDLFRRTERLVAELQEQKRRVGEIMHKVDVVVGEDQDLEDYDGDEGEGEKLVGSEKMEVRINESNDRTVELSERVDELRKKIFKLGGSALSKREVEFEQEVRHLEVSLDPAHGVGDIDAPVEPSAILHLDNSPSSRQQRLREQDREAGTMAARFQNVLELREKLVQQARELAELRQRGQGSVVAERKVSKGFGGEYKKRQLAQVMTLLERETALMEDVSERLARLSGTGRAY